MREKKGFENHTTFVDYTWSMQCFNSRVPESGENSILKKTS
jgi:hypothetical protein